jgi:hypothetical protein
LKSELVPKSTDFRTPVDSEDSVPKMVNADW